MVTTKPVMQIIAINAAIVLCHSSSCHREERDGEHGCNNGQRHERNDLQAW